MSLLAGVGIKHQGVSQDVRAGISVCPKLDEVDHSGIQVMQPDYHFQLPSNYGNDMFLYNLLYICTSALNIGHFQTLHECQQTSRAVMCVFSGHQQCSCNFWCWQQQEISWHSRRRRKMANIRSGSRNTCKITSEDAQTYLNRHLKEPGVLQRQMEAMPTISMSRLFL